MMPDDDTNPDDEASKPATAEKMRPLIERALSKQHGMPEDSIEVSAVDAKLADKEAGTFEQAAAEEYARLKNERERIEQISLKQDIKERKNYAGKIFYLVCVWLASVLLITIASGMKRCPVDLSDAVLIALISGVSINVIALFAIVTTYLFPKR